MPEVLRKYIPGQPDFIEYTRDLPKGSTSQKGKPEKPDTKDDRSGGGPKGKIGSAVSKVADKLAAMTS